MKRFFLVATCTVAIGLGSSGNAHAQLNYGFTIPTDGGLESTGTRLTSYGPQGYTSFYSPSTGFIGESTSSMNTLFGRQSYTNFYSPFTGTISESRGTILTPFGPMSYSTYNSPLSGPRAEARFTNATTSTNTSNFGNGSQMNHFVPWSNGWNGNGGGWHRR
jgi:hypothetical protein